MECCICNKETGGGIILLKEYICPKCESDIVNTSVDQLKYETYKRKIKDIWENFEN